MISRRAWSRYHAHGVVMLGTDAGDNAGVLTDGFRENRPSSDQLIVGIDAGMMLVSLRWRMLVSSTLVDRYHTQEVTSSPMMDDGQA